MRKIALLLLFYVSYTAVFSQTAKYSNDFLSIGVGAKWMGMGNIGSASCNDVGAAYWNPSGLIGMQSRYQIEALHASYFAGMASYNHIALGYKPDSTSAMAFSVIRFGVDDIPNTIDLIDENGNINYDRLKTFSIADYAFLFSYAKATYIPHLWVGGNAKLIYRNVGKFASAWGFGLDASARYQLNKWLFGATVKDITTTFNLWSFNSKALEITVGDSTYNSASKNNLEITLPRLILGISRTFKINENLNLTAETDFDFTFDGKRNTLISGKPASIDPHFGLEVGYKNIIFIRAGANNIQRNSGFGGGNELTLQPSLGVGIKFRSINIDYAMTNAGNQGYSRYSNIFSIRWSFDSFKPR
ncbi:MAG: PorV/PorQ family protein [Bacteroidales bacterium]|nr:PorV/PorQ family protein [Bacteroidales bacterium]